MAEVLTEGAMEWRLKRRDKSIKEAPVRMAKEESVRMVTEKPDRAATRKEVENEMVDIELYQGALSPLP